MKTNDLIYSFPRNLYSVFHFKCSDVPFNKEDSYTIEEFSAAINEPFTVYEKHIRAIEVEKRLCHISVETPTQEFPEPVDENIYLEYPFGDIIYKIFAGEYDDEMKKN